jgi:hypothetical protein
VAFFAGGTTSTGATAAFKVTNDGALTATNATITGAVTATSGSFTGTISASAGQIGGWAIGSDRITNLGATKYAGIIDTAADDGLAFFAGATSSSGASAFYSVTNAGEITATAGTIGGFTLSSTSLTAGTESTAVGLLPGTFPFFAGSSTASSAPFRVTSAGALTATDVTIVGTNETINSAVTGKLSLQPSASQAGSTILIDGTITFSGSLSASRPDNSRTVTVTGYSGTALVVGMFITTTSAQATLTVANAKILTVVGTTFTFESQSAQATIDASASSGTITAFTAYRSLQFSGGGVTRFQQTATSPGALAAGSLILGNNTGLNNIGTALLVIPADGELVFNSTVSNPAYDGGANLYSSNGTSTLNTSGNFTVGGTLTATTISATNYGLVAADIPAITLGTGTAGNYVASVTSGNSLISVSGTGEGAAVVLTGDLTPTFTTLNVTGLAEFDGSVTLGDTTADIVKILNIFTTSVATNSFNPKMFSATGATPGRFFQDTSSERYKTNIVYMEDSDGILDLKAVSYNDKVDYAENGEASPRQYGFLAEDLDANTGTIAFVNHDTEGRPDSVQYDRLVVPLHSAMRKLRSRIEELEGRLAALEGA